LTLCARIGLSGILSVFAIVVACSKANIASPSGNTNTSGGGSAPTLTAPTVDGPGDDAQLTTLRPTLTVRNGTTSNQAAGTRTYEFQIADNNGFAPIAVTKTGVAEGSAGTTSFTAEADLASATRFFWRARLVQGSTNSSWSTTSRFRTVVVGFNRPGELFDPLANGLSVGTPIGSTSFVADEGIKINDLNSYVRYQLPQTMAAGEFSMEVKGLFPNGPAEKMKVFSMFDGTGNLTNTRYEVSAQYRGRNGNPDNAISFKAVWGDLDVRLEPDLAQRHAGVVAFNPADWYFWQGIWTSNSFRLVIRHQGPEGSLIYDRRITAPSGTGPYAPSPHFAYLGATSGQYGIDTGSWPNVTYRNVWLSDKPRPTALGSALRADR
jgi:hypothetical protein